MIDFSDPLPGAEPDLPTEDSTEIIVEQQTDDNNTQIKDADSISSSMRVKLLIHLCIFCLLLNK